METSHVMFLCDFGSLIRATETKSRIIAKYDWGG